MNTIDIGTGRWVCWDWELIETSENVRLDMHKPVRKNVALKCDAPWETVGCGYPSLIKVGDTYRVYYRAKARKSGSEETHVCFCMAESKDGKSFSKPNLCQFDFGGSKENNIVFWEDRLLDNFAVIYDDNPDCPPDAKIKAMSQLSDHKGFHYKLGYYKSADGIHFDYVGEMPVKGTFDSHNLVMWNPKTRKYHLYLRNFHMEDGTDRDWSKPGAINALRDVRLSVSEDFIHWSEPEKIQYQENTPDYDMYTNQISRYPRADIFIGMPTRYCDRKAETVNYKYLPQWDGTMMKNRLTYLENDDRTGTAFTDCVLMTSRDGMHFNRTDEGFLSPGPENGYNWIYGDCYVTGICETAGDWPGEPNELSFYTFDGCGTRINDLLRYTVRMDGFYSWRGNFGGGEILTKPMTFTGEKMSVNFSTSALGALRIRFCDLDGNDLEGYDSGTLFGDSIDRPVEFEKPLSELSGKPVRLKLQLWDCDLYSFCFES